MIPEALINVINQVLNIDIRSKCRKSKYVYGRFIFCKIMHDDGKLTATKIGQLINIDRSTVLNALKKFDDLIFYDDFKDIYKSVLINYSFNAEMFTESDLKNRFTEIACEYGYAIKIQLTKIN